MGALKGPRLWLLFWLGLGVLGLIYVIIASSVQKGPKPIITAGAGPVLDDPALLTGELEKFAYAFPARNAPSAPFQLDGEAISLADFRGRVVLVNLWATWCAPCLKELPSLDALEGELGSDRFEVAAVASDPKGPEAAAAFLERLEIENLKLYADPQLRFASAIGGSNVLPVSVLYDAQGREIGRLVGAADWSSPEALRLIRAAGAS
ncbi:MAG: TlpA disulfide reductase family protein [Pseudomonadota bacterium]